MLSNHYCLVLAVDWAYQVINKFPIIGTLFNWLKIKDTQHIRWFKEVLNMGSRQRANIIYHQNLEKNIQQNFTNINESVKHADSTISKLSSKRKHRSSY